PLRVVFLSDLHTGSHTGDIPRLAAIVREAAGDRPDLVLFGGDYMNSQFFGGGRVPPGVTARLLAPLQGRHGRFAVLGNHDYMYGEDVVAEALREHGIAVLDHEEASFDFGGHRIGVVGVPDAHLVR